MKPKLTPVIKKGRKTPKIPFLQSPQVLEAARREEEMLAKLVWCPASNLVKGAVVLFGMKRGRPRKFEVILTEQERAQLEQMRGSRTLPAGIVWRARGILLSAQGQSNPSIARPIPFSPSSKAF